MIRRLTSQDKKICLELAGKQPAENLFIIGDIENFGFDQDFQKLWGEFDEENRLISILLKFYNNYIAFAEQPFDARGFAQIINEDSTFKELSGISSITELIEPYITHPKTKTRKLYYAKCDQLHQSPANNLEVKTATFKDLLRIHALHKIIPEFEVDDTGIDGMKTSMENGSSRTFFVEEDGNVISSASTTAENSLSAMVIGVCTHPDYKRRGLASQCMMKLCQTLLAEGKTLCLFYDNPQAGTIYKKLGFKDIGMWSMHMYNQKQQVAHS